MLHWRHDFSLLEALIIIFRDLDLGEITDFAYTLEYECRDNLISINSDPARDPTHKNKQVLITVSRDGATPRTIPYTKFRDAERTYLPSYVFGYYSGPSNRMEKHFDKHQDRFYRDLLKGVDKPLRPLLYARPVHSQFALLAFFIDEDEQLAEGEQSIRDSLDELAPVRPARLRACEPKSNLALSKHAERVTRSHVSLSRTGAAPAKALSLRFSLRLTGRFTIELDSMVLAASVWGSAPCDQRCGWASADAASKRPYDSVASR